VIYILPYPQCTRAGRVNLKINDIYLTNQGALLFPNNAQAQFIFQRHHALIEELFRCILRQKKGSFATSPIDFYRA
jgi:hypothetical protein